MASNQETNTDPVVLATPAETVDQPQTLTTNPDADPVQPTVASPTTGIVTTTPLSDLKQQSVTSGPTNPQVEDRIVNPLTNDDIIAQLPKKKNEAGVEQVVINEDGTIDGFDKAAQKAADLKADQTK